MILVYILIAIVFGLLITVKFLLPKPPRSFKSLKNKHILITGGSKGIGRAMARECVKRGGHVTIVARSEALRQTGQELMELAEGTDQKITMITVDLTSDYDAIKKTLNSNLDPSLSKVDILINNAGGSLDGEFDQLDADVFEKEMKLNYLSAVYVTKALIEGIKARAAESKDGCRIVFLSSQAGQLGLYGYSAYSSSKFALRGLAESLQMELKPYNIWVTVAYPPNTDTEGFANECLQMPLATKLISSTSGLLSSDYVAMRILDASCSGRFCCYFGLDGWMLAHLCAGMSPENHLGSVVQQILFSGIFRIISLFYLREFDSVVVKCIEDEKKTK